MSFFDVVLSFSFLGVQVVAITFVLAGVHKLRDAAKTVLTIRAYGILPRPMANSLGLLLPYAEVSIGAMLLLGLWPNLVVPLGVSLLIVFVVAQLIVLASGRSVSCGCFGGDREVSVLTVAVAMTLLAVTSGFMVLQASLSLPRELWWPEIQTRLGGYLVVVLAQVTAGGIVGAFFLISSYREFRVIVRKEQHAIVARRQALSHRHLTE